MAGKHIRTIVFDEIKSLSTRDADIYLKDPDNDAGTAPADVSMSTTDGAWTMSKKAKALENKASLSRAEVNKSLDQPRQRYVFVPASIPRGCAISWLTRHIFAILLLTITLTIERRK